MTSSDPLWLRAKALRLNGLIEHWDEVSTAPWLETLVQWEEGERAHRSLQRRIREARLGTYKAIADFDWTWPNKIDRFVIDELMSLAFLKEATNVILIGNNGVGKTTIARNIAAQALLAGYTVQFKAAGDMLGELASIDSDSILRRRLHHYATRDVLCIDEVGFLSFSNRYADLLFELVSRRYEKHSTIVTTNKPFSEWHQIFPSAACVVSLVDRLVHHAEVISIDAKSWRLKEAQERNDARAQRRKTRRHPTAGAA
jgi:DNA replication protein DnaC